MRRREVTVDDASTLPAWLVRFVQADWYDPTEPVPPECWADPQAAWTHRSIKAQGRWRDARDAWAESHGYDMSAKYGEKPGADSWAFLALVKQHPDALLGVVETRR